MDEELKNRIEWVKQCPVEAAELIQQIHVNQLLLEEQNKKFRKWIFELKAKTGYRVYEENLALIQQIEWYKDMLKGGNESDQCQTSDTLS